MGEGEGVLLLVELGLDMDRLQEGLDSEGGGRFLKIKNMSFLMPKHSFNHKIDSNFCIKPCAPGTMPPTFHVTVAPTASRYAPPPPPGGTLQYNLRL